MRLVVLGLSHKTAALDLREEVAVADDAVGEVARRAAALTEVAEVFVLSTCNRVELYAVPRRGAGDELRRHLLHVLTRAGEGEATLEDSEVNRRLYFLTGRAAVRHLLMVTASLDSMVVGEPQILGQVKEAARLSRQAGTVGPVLDRVLAAAFRGAKRARSETGIARARVSVGSVAVDLARRIFARLDACKVLLVGAGKMGEATAQALAAAGAARVYVCNRSRERAFKLAEQHRWRTRGFDELEDLLIEADVVITSTGAAKPIIDLPLLKSVSRRRKYRPLFLVDIAVPRNIDPAVARLDTVYLYNVDDLQAVSDENLRTRRREADAAEVLVEQELDGLAQWFDSLAIQPTIAAIRKRAMGIAQAEAERTLRKRLKHLAEADRKTVTKMLQAAMNKLLHPTMVVLKEGPAEGSGAHLAAAAQRLYGVEAELPAQGSPGPAPEADAEPDIEAEQVDPAEAKAKASA